MRGKTKTWRVGPKRSLFARSIPAKEMSLLIEAMKEDGLTSYIMSDGIHWSFWGYSLTAKSVMEAWGLSKAQYRRVREYVLVNDPFMSSIKTEGSSSE